MSETDSFIQEVTEEVRQDQMFKLWKKWAPLIIGGVAVIVGGAAYWSWDKAETKAAAEARGGQFIAAEPGQIDQQVALVDQMDGPAKLLAELTAAAALVEDDQTDEAAKRYAEIGTRTDIAPEYRDLANLQAIRLGALDDAMLVLGQMIEQGSPYRLLALEQRAAMHLQSGSTEAGHTDLNAIVADPLATTGLRQRAVALLAATGGQLSGADG